MLLERRVKVFSTSSLNLDYFAPNGSIGMIVLIVGIVITLATFYIFYNVSRDVDSVLDKRRKQNDKKLQAQKIARLYPKSK